MLQDRICEAGGSLQGHNDMCAGIECAGLLWFLLGDAVLGFWELRFASAVFFGRSCASTVCEDHTFQLAPPVAPT